MSVLFFHKIQLENRLIGRPRFTLDLFVCRNWPGSSLFRLLNDWLLYYFLSIAILSMFSFLPLGHFPKAVQSYGSFLFQPNFFAFIFRSPPPLFPPRTALPFIRQSFTNMLYNIFLTLINILSIQNFFLPAKIWSNLPISRRNRTGRRRKGIEEKM